MNISSITISRGSRLLFQLPSKSRVITTLNPKSNWGWLEQFTNRTNFLLETLLWQNSYDPKKKSEWQQNRPKEFIPKFMKDLESSSVVNKDVEAFDIDYIKHILSQDRG